MLDGEVFRGVHAFDEVKFESVVSLLTSKHRRLVSTGNRQRRIFPTVTNALLGFGEILCGFPYIIFPKNISRPLIETLPLISRRLELLRV